MTMNTDKLIGRISSLKSEEILPKLDIAIHKQGDSLKIRCFNRSAHKNGDNSPSLSVSRDNHKYHCFVCGVGGSDILSLLCRIFKRSQDSMLEFACHRLIHPVVPNTAVESCYERLLSEAGIEILDHLITTRGIARKVIDLFKIGMDENSRVTVPIESTYGLYCDLRRWDAARKDTSPHAPKMLPYDSENYGKVSSGVLWPARIIESRDDLLLCEGEGDTLRAISAGAAAITVIGGASTVVKNASFGRQLAGKTLSLCLDNDDPGKRATAAVIDGFSASGLTRIRKIAMPPEHKDLTIWLQASGNSALEEALATTAWEDPTKKSVTASEIPLSGIVRPEIVRTDIVFIGQVASVAMQPSLVPRKFRVTCSGDQGEACHHCPNNQRKMNGLYEIELTDDAYVDCLDQTDSYVRKRLAFHAGIPQVCKHCVHVVDTHPALPLKLIPGAHRPGRDVTVEHVTRDAVFAGHYLMAGNTSKFRGYTRPDPKTQKAITVITETTAGVRAWDGYEIPDYLAAELRSVYHGKNPYDSLYWTAEQLGTYYTRVAGRQLLHVVSDLVFHSILEIPVGGKLHNGFMDVLMVGETTSGKGATVEGMVNLYGAGEVVSGKRCTIAGLIGGTIRHSGGFDISIGVWALRDGEIVIMDEKTPTTVFSTLTRPRREGIAEFAQAGITHKAMARVRKIWVQNPPSGKSMLDYRYGIEVLRDLVPAAEDVARWDMVVGVLSDVSDIAIINASMPIRTKPAISREMLRGKLMWAWSRRHNHVNFHKSARDAIMKHTPIINEMYVNPAVGLVQSGSTHIKLRKGAAAVAAATFSTAGEDSKMVHVTADHVDAFVRVLQDALDAPALRMKDMCKLHKAKGAEQLSAALRRCVNATKDQHFMINLLKQASSNRRTWEALVPANVNGVGFVDDLIRNRGLLSDDGGLTLRLSGDAAKVIETFIGSNGNNGTKHD